MTSMLSSFRDHKIMYNLSSNLVFIMSELYQQSFETKAKKNEINKT